ncbi:MAG: hypothetical protein KGJ33_00695, partial [Patescibacteria group bacterium]|nr:hypothetical protein [Patescibacteria group bacterium]
MHSSLFFKFFPPPQFMLMKHAGLQVSDETIRCLEFRSHAGRTVLSKYGEMALPEGVIDGGEIKDEKSLASALKEFGKKHGLSYVKVSVPEEKSYLFQTDVPAADVHGIAQNIEFKLEENVPLAASDTLFCFDLMSTAGGTSHASVSVVPRSYIDDLGRLLADANMHPVAFEVLPKAVARAVIPSHAVDAELIVYIMKKKTGIYVVSRGVVCFTSTFGWGSDSVASEDAADVSSLTREINRIYTYWMSHDTALGSITKIVLVGSAAPRFEETLRQAVMDSGITVAVAHVWQNVLDIDHYVPPIEEQDSLNYAAAAGL